MFVSARTPSVSSGEGKVLLVFKIIYLHFDLQSYFLLSNNFDNNSILF